MRDKRPVHDHEAAHRIPTPPTTPLELAQVLSIPAGFAALALAFIAAGGPVPWWVIVGGGLYGGMAVLVWADSELPREHSLL